MEVSVLVDPCRDAFGVEAEAAQPLEVVLRDEAAVGYHVVELLVGEGEAAQLVEGPTQVIHKVLVVDRIVTVMEDECSLGLRKELEIGVRRGELVEIGVED